MKQSLKFLAAAAALACGLAAPMVQAQTLTSQRLSDTVKDGTGDINLLRDFTAAQLEAFRAASGGKLVFAVDVNENASGTEKASCQAVTVADAWLELRYADGSTRVNGHAGGFSTETQALVAKSGDTVRRTWYTVLGEAGSNRITGSSKIQQEFDSTLKITVPQSLAGVTSAVLKVRLLEVDPKKADPEAFYDFTGGFEDLALITPADTRFFDVELPKKSTFRQDAPGAELSPEGTATATANSTTTSTGSTSTSTSVPPTTALSWLQQPGADSYYTVAYEDNAPNPGDYDFNDLVVGYRYQMGINAQGLVERIDGTAYLVARGSIYRHAWTLDLPLPAGATGTASCNTVTPAGKALSCSISAANGLLRWAAFPDTLAAFPAPGANPGQPVNTTAGVAFTRGPKATFSVSFATPVSLGALAEGHPWLKVSTTGRTVQLGDRSASGQPLALLVPSAWKLPLERVDMGLAYPSLSRFISAGGTSATDWYLQPLAARVLTVAPADWAW